MHALRLTAAKRRREKEVTMKSVRNQILRSLVALTLVGAAVTLVVSTADAAFAPRVPQVTLGSGSLQGYFNGVGESINVSTDQLDAQTWSTTISGNSTLTLMLELAGLAGSNAYGIYNGDAVGAPALFQVFPGAATPGWYATAHFGLTNNLVVSLFDDLANYQGQTVYAGVNRNNFGFYIQNGSGTLYSQDARNGGVAEVLTFAGTGVNAGSWWECFEDLAGGDRDFDDGVIFVESVNPVPTSNTSWGRLKGLYR
jgi:hypothetical protein